jgi:hypothetical protein
MAENKERETSPIEFYRLSHTNKDKMMSKEAEEPYVRIMYNLVLLILKMKLMFEILLQTEMLFQKWDHALRMNQPKLMHRS